MKEFYHHLNKKLYYIVIVMIISLMVMGLLLANPRFGELDLGYFFHLILVVFLSIFLLIYPKFETHVTRTIMIIIGSGYFYLIFFLYPNTWSTFIFLCLIPAFSILFFDPKLFYFSLILNGIFITITFSYIMIIDQGTNFPHIRMDLTGNIINFIASQVILSFIYYLSLLRIKKQKLYYEQIQQSERLKTMGQLTAAVAHEIRNPLTVVKGFLQFYEKDPSLRDDVNKNFTLMIDELKTAEHIISQFLTIAKPDKEKKKETIDVKLALQSVTDLLKSYGLLHNNRLELNVEEDCYISMNIIEFKQLMINFVKNAIEASNKSNSVIIRAEKRKKYVDIQIIDHGCGMSEEEVKSLGTPFYSLKNKGTGLGLMICFNIVEKYNGTIHFTSSKGVGTTVTICFPIIH